MLRSNNKLINLSLILIECNKINDIVYVSNQVFRTIFWCHFPASTLSFSLILSIEYVSLNCFRAEDGRSLKPICLLQICRLGVIIYDWLDIPWLKSYYNFGFDHFNMSWKKAGLMGLLDCLLGNAGPFASGDWILPDLTIQGSIRLNHKLNTFPNTFYFSYATRCTRKIMGITVPASLFGVHPLFFIRVLQMSQWRHPPDASPPSKGYRSVLDHYYLPSHFVLSFMHFQWDI